MRILFFLVLLLLPAPAHACAYEAVQFDVAVTAAEKSFIGTVVSVEGRLAKINVEKAIRGVAPPEVLEVEIGEGSCAIRFQKGQRWFYLGDNQPSGSLLLRDDMGRDVAANIKIVNENMPGLLADEKVTRFLRGTIERTCAPWDGEAQMITLNNGVTVTFYDSLSAVEKKKSGVPAIFPADQKPVLGHGQIMRCPRTADGKPTDMPCNGVEGTIFIDVVDKYQVRGSVKTVEGDTFLFEVKRLEKQVSCG